MSFLSSTSVMWRRRWWRLGALLAGVACAGDSASNPTATPVVPSVANVTVTPATATVTVGSTVSLSAAVTDAQGQAVAVKTVSWASGTAGVATVSSAGVVTGVSAGAATITASVDGKSGSAVVTVSAASGGGTGTSSFQTTVPPIDFNVVPVRPTTTGISLSLYSASARAVTLTLLDGNRTSTMTLDAGTPATLELTGLSPDRTYRYRIDGPSPAYTGQFRTARSRGNPFTFAIQADSHLDSNSDLAVYTNTIANMVADSGDFLIDLGDTFMSDKYPDFRNAGPNYYAQRHYFGLTGRVLPLYLVQGNHDGELGWLPENAAWAAAQRVKWFPPVVANAFYRTSAAPRNYYAWSWGDATFVVLDPYYAVATQPNRAGTGWAWTLGREQYDWLTATLQATTTPYIFVFLHNLVGGSTLEGRGGSEASVFYEWGGTNADGTAGFAAQRPGWAMPIHDLLVLHKVQAVFHGHDHLWVNQLRDGIRYQEVPQPSLAREGNTSSAAEYGYLSGVILGSSGHVRVTVTAAKATVEYVRSRVGTGNGGVADRYDMLPAGARIQALRTGSPP